MGTHTAVPPLPHPRHNLPLYSMVGAGLFLTCMTVLVITGNAGPHGAELLIGLGVTTIPSLIASGFSERVARDVRNGVVAEQSRQGAVKALDETGVIEAVETGARGQSTVIAMQAIQRLLEQAEASGTEREERRAREAEAAAEHRRAQDTEGRKDTP